MLLAPKEELASERKWMKKKEIVRNKSMKEIVRKKSMKKMEDMSKERGEEERSDGKKEKDSTRAERVLGRL